MYGPTAGDRVRLGDTDLFAQIDRDYTDFGNEIMGGWGKNLRTGMMYSHRPARDSELDSVILNAIVMDPAMGIFKGSIGIKDGIIVASEGPAIPTSWTTWTSLSAPTLSPFAGTASSPRPAASTATCTSATIPSSWRWLSARA